MTNYKELTSRKAVFAAIADCDARGIEGFRARYGYGAAETYHLKHEGRAYDSKAIVGVAYGFQFPDRGPLKSDEFSGGKTHAGRHLVRLGFEVEGLAPRPDDWTLLEVEQVVATYFAIAAAQAAGEYSRKDELSKAQALIPTRNPSAVERKLSNICAYLAAQGHSHIHGFGSLPNNQTLLKALINDWLSDNPDVYDPPPTPASALGKRGVEVEPPSNLVLKEATVRREACSVDFAGRDARNRLLGRLGEEWALSELKAELRDQGRDDLAERVIWASSAVGDGLGYDIESFDSEGVPVVVEVKTTNQGQAAPFLVSANEVARSKGDPNYVLMRVFSFAGQPAFYRLRGDLAETCQLQPKVFAAAPAPDG